MVKIVIETINSNPGIVQAGRVLVDLTTYKKGIRGNLNQWRKQ